MRLSRQVVNKQNGRFLFLPVLILLIIFFIVIYHLTRESMAYDEGWSMWAVRPNEIGETIARVAADVHPPLYFLALDGWLALGGESEMAARLLSVAGAMLGLAATYAVGSKLFDRWTALIALIVLGTSSFFVYYAREARMYSLLLALAALSMYVYWRWQHEPSRFHSIIYAITMAALLYTHYYGLLIIATQVFHLLFIAPKQISRWLLCGGGALALLLPWLPIWFDQIHLHPHGPLATPIPTNAATVTWLIQMLTSGLSLGIVVPWALGRALPRIRHYRSEVWLVLLWLMITPLVVLTLNAYVAPLYQPRYIIGSLPAFALLMAYGLRHVFWKSLAAALLVGLVCVQLLAYPAFWPDRPHWKESMEQMIAARRPNEPTLTLIAPQSIEAYYDRRLGLRNARAIDLAGRPLAPGDWSQVANAVDAEPSVWVVLPTNLGVTWDIVTQLSRDRHVGYRDSIVNVIFYRFDRGGHDDRLFRFGQLLQLDDVHDDRSEVQPGATVCAAMTLSTLGSLDPEYSAGLHLVNEANTLIAQQDNGLNAPPSGQRFNTTRCVEIPTTASEGIYYLHWVIYNWTNGERLHVLEGDGAGVFWGDAYVAGRLVLKLGASGYSGKS